MEYAGANSGHLGEAVLKKVKLGGRLFANLYSSHSHKQLIYESLKNLISQTLPSLIHGKEVDK